MTDNKKEYKDKDKDKDVQSFTLRLKEQTDEPFKPVKLVEEPMGSGKTNNYDKQESMSMYRKFRHFMYEHLQNKWVKTVLLALFGAAIIVAMEVLFKIFRGH